MKFSYLRNLIIIFLTVSLFLHSIHMLRAAEVNFEEDRQLPIVYLNLAIKSGAVSDPKDRLGLTHFMAEMLTRGTQHRSKTEIDQALDQMGAKLEVEVRAESLILRGAVLSTQLPAFLSLLSEVATEPSFPEKEIIRLKSEITSIIQEELGNDSSLANRKFTEFLFQGHPYGNPILGKKADIAAITQSQLIQHHQKLFEPHSVLVIGSGDSTEAVIQNWTEELEKKLPKLTVESSSKAHTDFTTQVASPTEATKRRLQIIDKPDRTQTQINIGQLGVRMDHPQFFPLHVGNHAVGGASFSAMLMTEIRVKRGWSYGAYSNFRYGLKPRSWQVHLFPAAKDAGQALNYTLKLLDEVKKQGISEDQFLFARKSLINSAGFLYNTPRKRVENTLLEKTLHLPAGYMKSFATQIEKVKFDEVNSSLNQFIKPDQLSISVLGTASQLKKDLMDASHVTAQETVVIPYTQE